MESIDAVGRLEVPGSNIDRAVGDNRLRAKYEAEWFAVRVGERTEEGAERALEHHQLAIIGNVVHNTVGDSDSGFGFPRHFAPPQERTVCASKAHNPNCGSSALT